MDAIGRGSGGLIEAGSRIESGRFAGGRPPATPLIALRRISRIYDGGAVTALRNVELEIAEGSSVAMVGVSGSGKSSLVNILCGLDYPSSGHVAWEGRVIRSRRAWVALRRNRIGIVFQEYNLIPTLTAVENIEMTLLGRGLSKKHRYTRAGMLLAHVGLEHHPHRVVSRLSGGERQRVAIARAMASEPKLLVADEPTGNLDTASAERIADLLFDLHEQNGMALVLATHDDTLAARCDRRIRLRDGVVVEDTLRAAPIAGALVDRTRP